MQMIEVDVEGLALDMATNSPVVILSPVGFDKVLPIWIGHAEAWGIAMQLSGVDSKRPLTYDLLRKIINTLNARVERIEVTELRDQTFYAIIYISHNDQQYEIDARPSDSIAVALKTGAKIYVNEALFHLEKDDTSPNMPETPNDPETLRERLKRINPEDFGKYSL